jgi:hypothetical protein
MKRFMNKKVAAIGLAAGLLLGGAGIAYAVWLSPNGTGNGHAIGYQSVAANISTQSTNPNNSDGTDLYPGSSVTNTVTITNTNPYPIEVTSISAGSSLATGAGGACVAGTVTSASQTGSPILQSNGTGTTIAADTGTGTYNVVYSMASSADTTCQGASFVLALTVGEQSGI